MRVSNFFVTVISAPSNIVAAIIIIITFGKRKEEKRNKNCKRRFKCFRMGAKKGQTIHFDTDGFQVCVQSDQLRSERKQTIDDKWK